MSARDHEDEADARAFRTTAHAAASLPDPLPIPRLAGPVTGAAHVPGSKSLTNRHLVLAALAAGRTRLEGVLRSDDCDRLAAALAALGAAVARPARDACVVDGVGGRFPRGGTVHLGDGGTPTRFMIAAAALAAEAVTVDGSPRMRERPVADGLAIMRGLGGAVEALGAGEHLPVVVGPCREGGLPGGSVEVARTASSQFLSAAMLIAPWTRDGVELVCTEPPTSAAYLELTVEALAAWSVRAEVERAEGGTIARLRVPGGAPPAAGDERTIAVEADASSAIYPAVLAALRPGSRVRLPLDAERSAQPDARAILALRDAGAAVEVERDGARATTVVAAPADGLRSPGTIDAEGFPDGALALAALASALPAPVAITGLRTLRVKETDRIAALATELRRVGAAVEESDDHLAIDPAGIHAAPVVIETYDDHRMAMAFALVGLARGGVAVRDPGCVAKSHPGFWRDLAALLGDG